MESNGQFKYFFIQKNCKLMRVILTIVAISIILLFPSCKKKAARDRQNEIERMEGTWNVNSYEVETFDTTGLLISKTTTANTGSIKFELSSSYSKKSNLAFNSAQFNPTTLPHVYEYLFLKGAGDVYNGIYFCHWEVDPDKKRMMFWATAPLNSFNINCDVELIKNGKKERILRFISPQQVVTVRISKQ